MQLETDVERLRDGRAITKPVYNHRAGTFESPVPFASKKIIILEGLHTLFTPRLRELMDFSVFVYPDAEVRHAWKRRRDTGVRGYSPAEVTEEITRREKDYETYIAPQRCRQMPSSASAVPGTGKRKGKRKKSTGFPPPAPDGPVIEYIDLNIDLYSLLSFHDHNFMIEFSTEDVACARKCGR